MNGVLSEDIAVQDYELHRYGDERIGVHWTEWIDGEYVDKDLSDWDCELTLESLFQETLLKLKCTVTTVGRVWGDILDGTLRRDPFIAYTHGVWRIVGRCKKKTELIGEGNFIIVDGPAEEGTRL